MFTSVRFAQRTPKTQRAQREQESALLLELPFNSVSGLCELCGFCEQPTRRFVGQILNDRREPITPPARHSRRIILDSPVLLRYTGFMTLRAISVGLVYFAVIVACLHCGGSPSSEASLSVKGSCNNAPKGFCNDFTGSQYSTAQVQAACKAQNVAYAATACPSAGRVGTCLVYSGAPTESYYRYYGAFPGGVAAAESQCKNTLKGTWTAHLSHPRFQSGSVVPPRQ